MRVVVVSNATMQPLASRLHPHDVVVSGVGDLPAWLIDSASPAHDAATDVVIVHAHGESLLPPLGNEDQRGLILDCVAQFASGHPTTQVVITTLLSSARSASAYADPTLEAGRFRGHIDWNLRLAELAEEHPNVTVLDSLLLLEQVGLADVISPTYWYAGRMPYSARGFDALAVELSRILDALVNRARRLLILDLDNTLWGGVVGEDGIAGIALSEEGVGKCFRDFQRQLKALQSTGVVLAVVSKNDEAIVDLVFTTHPMMVLSRDDFVSVVASWSNKPELIRDLSQTLSLGLDSFVFIDDNPVEREFVRTQLPEVAVPDFPARPELLSRWLLGEVVPQYFPKVRILDEDRLRTRSYKARDERRAAESLGAESFLRSLDVRLHFAHDPMHLVDRLSQLTQKTNQFNLTTERLSPAEVAAFVDSSNVVVIACDYEDRFANEGTIGLAIVDLDAARLKNLLLSCRVLGRGVEDALLAEVEAVLRKSGRRRITATFIPTARNSVAATFLARNGYVGYESADGWVGDKELQ